MGDLNDTLTDVGNGLGAFFEAIDLPLATLIILLGIAGGVGAVIMAVASFIRKAF
jgi:hypothetical protein